MRQAKPPKLGKQTEQSKALGDPSNICSHTLTKKHLPPTEVKSENRLDASLDADGILIISSSTFSRKNFALELVAQQDEMPMGDVIIKELREGERY
jgi:hypothetical protein